MYYCGGEDERWAGLWDRGVDRRFIGRNFERHPEFVLKDTFNEGTWRTL